MKHRIVTIGIGLCIAAAFAVAVDVFAQGQEPQQAKTKDVSLTGCLVQGSGPNVFILENAKADPRDSSETGHDYLLTTYSTSISFREHLNHEEQIDGSAETRMPPVPPMGQKLKESDLPKLTASALTHVAETCSQRPYQR